jgi:hypothetical protein
MLPAFSDPNTPNILQPQFSRRSLTPITNTNFMCLPSVAHGWQVQHPKRRTIPLRYAAAAPALARAHESEGELDQRIILSNSWFYNL